MMAGINILLSLIESITEFPSSMLKFLSGLLTEVLGVYCYT